MRPASTLLALVICFQSGCGATATTAEEIRLPPAPTAHPPLPRVTLSAATVADFVVFAGRSGTTESELAYIRSELDRARGELALENAFTQYLDQEWAVSDGKHRIDDLSIVLTAVLLIRHLATAHFIVPLVTRLDVFVSNDEEHLGVRMLQGAAGEALACVRTDEGRAQAEAYAANHPSVGVREAIARTLRDQRCLYGADLVGR